MFRLIIEDEEGHKSIVPLIREQISIGRREGNNIRLTERNVSRRHARVVRDQELFYVEDLNSYNGIRVNGERVAGRQPLNEGDLIEIGDYQLHLQREALPAANLDTDPFPAPKRVRAHAKTEPLGRASADTLIERRPFAGPRAPAPEAESGAVRLVVLNPMAGLREVKVPAGGAVLGTEGDVRLPPLGVVPQHAEVALVDGIARIRDLGGGLRINGEARQTAELREGDLVELGDLKLRFIAPPPAPTAPPALTPTPLLPSDLHVKTQPDYRIPVPVERTPVVPEAPETAPDAPAPEPRRKVVYVGIGVGAAVLAVGLYLALRPTGSPEPTPPAPTPPPAPAARQAAPVRREPPPPAPTRPPSRSRAELPAPAPTRAPPPIRERLPAESPTLSTTELLERALARERAGRWRAAEGLYRRAARAGAAEEAAEGLERIRQAREAARRRAALEEARAAARASAKPPAPPPPEKPPERVAAESPGTAASRLPPALAASRLPPPAKRIDPPPEKTEPSAAEIRRQALAAARARRRNRARARKLFAQGTKILLSSPVQAIGILRQAMRADPRFPDVHKNLGIAYGAVGNTRAAGRHYQRYLKMRPSAPDASQVKRLLEELGK